MEENEKNLTIFIIITKQKENEIKIILNFQLFNFGLLITDFKLWRHLKIFLEVDEK